jgi:hypothetical protein
MTDLQHVATVQQRGDNTVVVYVQTDSFKPGQEVEVSVYLTQGNAYAAHIEKKRIPLPDPNNLKQPAVLHVELPATELDTGQDVTVITRVAEVWPSVLQQDPKMMKQYKGIMGEYLNQGLKAVWTYQDLEGKEPGDPESPPPGNGGGRVTTLPQQEPTA